MTLDLHNFFKFYDEKNPNHVAAVQWLEDKLPEKFLDDAETDWIGIFRTKPPTPAVLNVPYFNQVDNYRDAHRTCNSSSCAMCLAFLKPGSIKGDDEYVKKVFAIGDTTDHAVQTKVLAGYGVKSHFSYNLSFADVDKSLDAGKPVVIGILHRGSLSAPTGGHMCVVIGKTPDGNAYFTRSMGMLVSKSNLGFGDRSWRYAAVVDNGIIEKLFVEVGQRDNADTDPYEATTPEMVLDYVKSTVRETVTA